MKLYDPITKDSIVHEVFRICGANANTYTIRDIIARVNSALDRFCHLAFQVDGRWSFDDINESSAPIDTQNIVSGTNEYKFSDFTEKIINLIKLTVLDGDAVEQSLTVESMDSLSQPFTELYDSSNTGTPTHYLKYGDFIYLRPYPDYSEANGLRAYFNRPASKFDFNTIAISGDAFTAVANGLSVNDTVMLETDGALPTGISVDTVYYVKTIVSADVFNIAATKGGTKITTTNSASGIHYFTETSQVPGIAEIYQPYLARHASLPYLIEKSLPQVGAIASQIQLDELAIKDYFANRDKDVRNIIKPKITPFR